MKRRVLAKVGKAFMYMLPEHEVSYEIDGFAVNRLDFDSYVAALKADAIASAPPKKAKRS